jgi:hypothetical protein
MVKKVGQSDGPDWVAVVIIAGALALGLSSILGLW